MAASTDEMDITIDVIIPCSIMLGLFIINGLIFAYIMRKRRQIVYEDITQYEEGGAGAAQCLNGSGTTTTAGISSESAVAAFSLHVAGAAPTLAEDECAIEMERL